MHGPDRRDHADQPLGPGPGRPLYVLEIDSDNILGGSTDGGLWTVSRRGVTRKVALPAGTLTEPGGIAIGRHAQLYVSNHSREAGTARCCGSTSTKGSLDRR